MARHYFINGESMVAVKGASNTGIGSLQNLGLAEGPIQWTPEFSHLDVKIDAWGNTFPNDVQWMLACVNISMTLVHFDPAILDICIAESMAGASAAGTLQRAGILMGGNGIARFSPGNHYIGLNITSPVEAKPYCFLHCYLAQSPVVFPLGTERSLVQLNWRCVPYAPDPFGGGTGAQGVQLWSNTLDS